MDYLKEPNSFDSPSCSNGIDNYKMQSGVKDRVYLNNKLVACFFNLDADILNHWIYPIAFGVDSLCRAIGTNYHMKDESTCVQEAKSCIRYGFATHMYKGINRAYKAHKTKVSPQEFKDWFKYYVIPIYNRDTNWNTYAKSPYSIKKIYRKMKSM